MNAVLEEIYRTNRALDLDGNSVDVSTAGVPVFDGEALHHLVRERRPKQTLETGFAFGLSTLFILQALRENGSGRHIAVDPFERTAFKGVGLANVKRAGFEDIFTCIEDYAANALPQLHREGARIDFAFIDGHHTFDQAFLDFYYCDLMMDPGAVVVFHDFSMPAVRKVVTFVLRNLDYELVVTDHARALPFTRHLYHRVRMMLKQPLEFYGWKYSDLWAQCNYAVLRKRAVDSRAWDHYVPF